MSVSSNRMDLHGPLWHSRPAAVLVSSPVRVQWHLCSPSPECGFKKGFRPCTAVTSLLQAVFSPQMASVTLLRDADPGDTCCENRVSGY